MSPFLNLLALLLLTLLPLTTAWQVDIYYDRTCNVINGPGETGTDSTCLQVSGNSWNVFDNGGCGFLSWSGNNCEGSSYPEEPTGDDGCEAVPFASIEVFC